MEDTLNYLNREENEKFCRMLAKKLSDAGVKIELNFNHAVSKKSPTSISGGDELRLTRRLLDFRILLYYNVFTNQSYSPERI